MGLQIIKKIPQDHSEVDRIVTDWLASHHIRAKDVRAYVINRRVNDVEVMTLEVFTDGVDEIGPVPVIKFKEGVTEAEIAKIKERFKDLSGRAVTVLPKTEIHTEDTMRKVRNGLITAGIPLAQITDAINGMQSEGILFRERA